MKKILLIGSTGYIGKKLKLKLSRKYSLICPKKEKGFDIKKKREVKKYLNHEIDYVINLSGQQNTKKKEMFNVITRGNENILQIANKIEKKMTLVFISTSLVYGYSEKILKEDSKKNPTNYYEKIKYEAEKNYIKTNKDYLILRLCNIYGEQNKSGIIGKHIKSIKNKKNFYFDNINTFKNFIYINDVVNIIETLIRKNVKNKILNIGNENISFINLSKFLSKIVNNYIIPYDKKLNIKKTLSQKINNNKIKNIMKNYNFKSLSNFLKNEIKNN